MGLELRMSKQCSARQNVWGQVAEKPLHCVKLLSDDAIHADPYVCVLAKSQYSPDDDAA